MAKVDCTPDDVAAMQRDIDEVSANLKKTRAEMLSQGPRSVPMDISTAIGHIGWLKRWSEKISHAPSDARLRLDAEKTRERLASKLNKRRKA